MSGAGSTHLLELAVTSCTEQRCRAAELQRDSHCGIVGGTWVSNRTAYGCKHSIMAGNGVLVGGVLLKQSGDFVFLTK